MLARFQQMKTSMESSTPRPKLFSFLTHGLFLIPYALDYLKGIWNGKHKPYPTYAGDGRDGIYPLRAADGGEAIKISIAGDWGTGTNEAFQVAEKMSAFQPDYTLHLGDVYYVGDDREVKENFLGQMTDRYTPVSFPKGSVGTFALVGNHEMYGGGSPYFGEMLSYCRTGTGESQKASFFCLETAAWRILGLDTGYNSFGIPVLGVIPDVVPNFPFFKTDCHLPEELLDWLRTNVKPQQNKKPTLLLSHHQYFSGFPKEEGFRRPAEQLKEFFAGQDVVWIWGHEHRLAIYDRFSPDGSVQCYGRCLGNGGMPVETGDPDLKKAPLAFYDPRSDYPIGDGTHAGWNGFLNLTLHGSILTLDYRDLENRQLFVERFFGHSDGSLQNTYQTPVPMLKQPTS